MDDAHPAEKAPGDVNQGVELPGRGIAGRTVEVDGWFAARMWDIATRSVSAGRQLCQVGRIANPLPQLLLEIVPARHPLSVPDDAACPDLLSEYQARIERDEPIGPGGDGQANIDPCQRRRWPLDAPRRYQPLPPPTDSRGGSFLSRSKPGEGGLRRVSLGIQGESPEPTGGCLRMNCVRGWGRARSASPSGPRLARRVYPA